MKSKFQFAYSSSASTERVELDSPDSVASGSATLIDQSSGSLDKTRQPFVKQGSRTAGQRHLESSRSLLSLFGNTAGSTAPNYGSQSGLIELGSRISGGPMSKIGPQTGVETLRSSTTILDTINRPAAFPTNASDFQSGRSGRIGLDYVIRSPLVEHRPTTQTMSMPLGGRFVVGHSGTLQHATARNTRSGIYESLNTPLSPREGLYRRRRSFDDDDFDTVPYYQKEFLPGASSARRCK